MSKHRITGNNAISEPNACWISGLSWTGWGLWSSVGTALKVAG
ncbi:Unknown protein sequence [Pseudomonas savastanoi pv. glycinea]|uniref:Uncharacterized protein n=1 Tax=Pseudomonas savastanoi pv. glycinea TaxID=318 RepID=A0ABR5L6X0_PSESG|nr:Unknown protein sequence [Pseudomonas savastanoi pv. glycinea]KPC40422.1 Unknown protein sequence [Pseudomonas savastanoi pv. glycinea]KPC41601.1 Unknown protein sequence [Pseudomonas savastanoi pv. glycinea]